MSVNYDRVCRLCLTTRGELLPIFPTISSDDSESPVLALKIKDCVSVQINENDDLPTNICRKCVDNVNNWHVFKTVCVKSQNKLQFLKRNDSQLEELNIKSEPLSDEAYDDGIIIDGSYPGVENAATGSANKIQPEGPPILASLGLTPRSDKKCMDPRMDWHRVHAILDMVQDDDIADSLQYTEESDLLHHTDHDSESEAELQTDVDYDYVDSKNGYLCKNNMVISKAPKMTLSDINIKQKAIIKLRKRKIFPVTKTYSQPHQAWQQLFTDDLLELIVNSTNKNIRSNHKAKCTNINEIKSFCGILYFHGIMRPTHQKICDLWHKDYGVICIRKSMKLERFKFLLQNLRFYFDDGDSIIQLDIMKRIRKVFEIFAMNCRTAFNIDNLAVIDEVIVPVYGPCPFRYDIDKKPLKRGIKMILLVDPKNFYISNLDVITDPYFGADDIVIKTTQHLAGTGKTVIMDNWFTSYALMERLKNDFQLCTIAALDSTSENIPPIFFSKHRKNGTFMTGFLDSDYSIASYVNFESKSVNILTNEPKFYKRGHVNHNTVVSEYKKYQSAVEVVDVLMHYYTTMQYTNDWTMSIFFTLLNIASINTQVMWSSQNSSDLIQRRYFIKTLAISLLEINEDLSSYESPAKISSLSILTEMLDSTYKKRRRCKICARLYKRDRKTKVQCIKCGQAICREHTVNICTMCTR